MAEDRYTNAVYGPTILRISLGLLFLAAGIAKLMNPSMPRGMLTGLGFPLPDVFAWVLIAVEIVCGLMLIVGWKVEWAVWPLVVVLLVAIALVTAPAIGTQGPLNTIWHLVGVAGLVSLFLTGPGKWALGEK